LSAPLIVLDTGVVVRALTGRPDSASSEVVRAAQTGEVRLAVSDAFLAETIRVLREPRVEARIGSAGRAFEVALDLGFMGRHYRPRRHDWPSVPDPNDGWMPDLAFASEADFIVTWDPHLLDHEIPLPVEVVTPAELLQRLRTDRP
jgi:putative PIN family toxin of toxin-antitoxin system